MCKYRIFLYLSIFNISCLLSSGQKECPGEPIKNSYNGPIRDLITNNSYGKRYPKKFFYQEMHMPVDELESKKPVKVSLSFRLLKNETQ